MEIIDFNNNAGTYDIRDFTGQTLIATSTGGTNTSITFNTSATVNADLSGITGNEAQIDFTVSSTAALDTTISGTQIKDTITGGSADDTISGNGGADVLRWCGFRHYQRRRWC